MKTRERLTLTALAMAAAVTLAACGGSDDAQSGSDPEKTDHVWKDKTGAIDKARDVQRVLDESRK